MVRECACVELTSHPNTGSIKTTGVVLGDDLIQKIDEERDGVPRSLFIRRILWARYQEEEEEKKKRKSKKAGGTRSLGPTMERSAAAAETIGVGIHHE